MKTIILIFGTFFASTVQAQTCLSREKDVINPELTVESFLPNDLNRPLYIDYATTDSGCTEDGCKFAVDDVFVLEKKNTGLALIWIKKNNVIVRMKTVLSSHTADGLSINFLRSEPSNGFIYYIMKNGTQKCEKIPRWSSVLQYSGKDCSNYTIEAFHSNPNSEQQQKYIEPDDLTVELTDGACGGPTQPGTGSGGEPPP